MSDSFIALDVETANADLASICQIGIVAFDEGEITDSWMSLVNPEDEFDPVNISIHGIDEDSVSTAPTFPSIHRHLSDALTGRIVASHMAFDKLALTRAHERYDLPCVDASGLTRRGLPVAHGSNSQSADTDFRTSHPGAGSSFATMMPRKMRGPLAWCCCEPSLTPVWDRESGWPDSNNGQSSST